MKTQSNSPANKEFKVIGAVHSKKIGKGHKIPGNGGDEKAQEIKAYLSKLQELVPFMPRNRKLSKLEVISNVIDYIHDLRETLGIPSTCCGASFQDDDLNCLDGDSDVEDICEFGEHSEDICVEARSTTADTTLSFSLIRNGEPVTSMVSSSTPQSYSSQWRQPLCVITDPGNNKSSESDSCSGKQV